MPRRNFFLNSQRTAHTHIYRYVEDFQLRTSQDSLRHAAIALQTNEPYMGVKGPCAFSSIMPDFITGSAIDRMHNIDGGVVKELLSLWFQSQYSAERFSLVQVKDAINERLISIKPPRFVHKMPRSVDELISHGKASEFKAWLFYYSLPILSGIMDPVFFSHYCLLVLGITLLNTNTVTNENIDVASNLLFKFVLTTSHLQSLTMQKYLEELPEGPIRTFCSTRKYGVKICEKLSSSCYSVGTYKNFRNNILPDIVQQTINNFLPIKTIQYYLRLLKNSKLYISQQYTRALQTQSSTVLYKHEGNYNFGSVYCFLKILKCQCDDRCQCTETHYAVIQEFSSERIFNALDNDNTAYDIFHLYKCSKRDSFILIPVASLITVCIEMIISDDTYVGIPINSRENE
ncbi:Protein of unknown function [Cotesia congregata]|uniref:Uncharacterized protein n=1 Tax=Cotesia congregata TaxID=51543 RepID=A0A8J2EK29_COTCN|nr:Protein of unknown function [Cotesia congregata]